MTQRAFNGVKWRYHDSFCFCTEGWTVTRRAKNKWMRGLWAPCLCAELWCSPSDHRCHQNQSSWVKLFTIFLISYTSKTSLQKKTLWCYLKQTYQLLLEHQHILIIKFMIVLFHPLPLEMRNPNRIQKSWNSPRLWRTYWTCWQSLLPPSPSLPFPAPVLEDISKTTVTPTALRPW